MLFLTGDDTLICNRGEGKITARILADGLAQAESYYRAAFFNANWVGKSLKHRARTFPKASRERA